MAREFEPEVSLPLSELRKVMEDLDLDTMIKECSTEDSPGSCVQDALLEKLVNIYGQPDGFAVESMLDWAKEDAGDACRACELPVTVQWYVDELKAQHQDGLADDLAQAGESADPLTVAEKLDKIKESVDPDLRTRLVDFDTATQVNSQHS